MARGEHRPSCAREWRARAAREGWTVGRTVQAIRDCCGVSPLKAHRLARGWTARVTVAHLESLCRREGLGAPHVNIDLLNAWENGRSRPRPDSQDLLARLYKANAVRLGLAADYCEEDESALEGTAVAPSSGRRLLAEVEEMRRRMDLTLSRGTLSEGQLDLLDEALLRYRREYPAAPPLPMLGRLMREFTELQALCARRQPASVQRRLSHMTAALSVLTADSLMKLGDIRQAHAWYGTARTAADDTEDPRLRALVRAHEAMLPYYYGDLEEVVRLAREAQAIARGSACSPTALAAAAEARALSRLGDVRGARAALERTQQIYSRLSGQTGRAFDFTEQRLFLYLSGIHAHLPDTGRALEVQGQALALQPGPGPVPVLDPVFIRLDQAVTLARSGDAVVACRLGEETLRRTPHGHRTDIVYAKAREILAVIPSGRRPEALEGLRDALHPEGSRPPHV
ncbi:XRE family transcriptional regulator [Actinocorallia aurantiaca]|uniref:XRE family transcriptional regulator n=1 Tax=Actinocorallia aurantiaca TaxID=46204 RepID=A0ABN3U920_9ACTN